MVLGSEEDISVVGETFVGDEACSIIRERMPDVAFLNLLKPSIEASNIIRKARKSSTGTRFIAFVDGDSLEARRAFFDLKIAGLLQIDSGPEEIKLAVRNVFKGGTYVDSRVAQLLFDKMVIRKDNVLSARQIQVLKMIADGFTNKRISAELGISQDTVKTHVRVILKKLNAADRAQAVAKAYDLDILTTNAC
jgi:DNA-binding NarL/FixJ family response regulator